MIKPLSFTLNYDYKIFNSVIVLYLQELFKQYCSKEFKTVMHLLTYTEADVLILMNKIKDTFDQLIICYKNKVNIFSILFYLMLYSYFYLIV